MKTENYPFLFFGAGLANYYEWCTFTIKFIDPPNSEKQNNIIALAPQPIKPETADFNCHFLNVCSDQFVNAHIEANYGNEKNEEFDNEFYVSDEAAIAFEKDIQRWLNDVHKICSIDLVCRLEDSEAGGTELSEWHKESSKETSNLFIAWQAEPENKYIDDELENLNELIEVIMDYGRKRKVPIELAKKFIPKEFVQTLILKKEITGLATYLKQISYSDIRLKLAFEGIYEYFLFNDNLDFQYLYNLFNDLLKYSTCKSLFEYSWMEIISSVLVIAAKNEDIELLQKIKTNIVTNDDFEDIILGFNESAVEFLNNKNWIASIYIYDFILDIIKDKSFPPYNDYSIFNNALYVLQNDNAKLGVNVKANEKFLSICLQHAEKNPSIYFNATCLYIEMKDYTKALGCIANYFNSKDSKKKKLFKSLKQDQIFKEFLELPDVKTFLDKLVV